MRKCPNCGTEIENEELFACSNCGAELPRDNEIEAAKDKEPIERQERIQPVTTSADRLEPESSAPPTELRPRPQSRRREGNDFWDVVGERWAEMTVGAQVALIGSVAGAIGFIVFLFALTRAGFTANISFYTILLPFVISMYLLFSSSDASFKTRILTYSLIIALGGFWFQPILLFPVNGLWWALWLLGLIAMIGGGFLALWDLTRELEQ